MFIYEYYKLISKDLLTTQFCCLSKLNNILFETLTTFCTHKKKNTFCIVKLKKEN